MTAQAHATDWSSTWERLIPLEERQAGRTQFLVQLMPFLLLLYLAQPAEAILGTLHGLPRILGIADLVALTAVFLGLQRHTMRMSPRTLLMLDSALALTAGIGMVLGHANGLPLAIFILVPLIQRFGTRALPAIASVGLVVLLLPACVASWHTGLGVGPMISVMLTSIIVLAFVQLYRVTVALSEAHTRLATLAAELERTRIARDLHDVLGHSLSAIALKSSLAARLAHSDPGRATEEAEAVAALARETLTEVRRTVLDLRQVSLATELAVAGELLAARGVRLLGDPRAELVDPRYQELFGWVLREAVTNVLRHSEARSVAIELAPTSITVRDDGACSQLTWGNGLAGLAERVARAGGQLEVRADHGVTVLATMGCERCPSGS